MKKKKFVNIVAFGIIFVMILNSLGEVFRNKVYAELLYTYRNIEENSLDVLFIGASTNYRFFSPQELWNDYGIASYNLGTSEQSISESYYVLQYALKTQQPTVVVFDVTSMITYAKPLGESRVHLVLDNLEINQEWFKALNGLTEENKLEYLFPLLAYHDRWKELKKSDFEEIESYTKGSAYNYAIESFSEDAIKVIESDYLVELKPEAEEWINKIVDSCANKGCSLLLTVNPVPELSADKDRGKALQGMYHTLEQKADGNYMVLNMFGKSKEIGLDLAYDYSDAYHVNVAGTMKMTNYIGAYLVNNYDLPDRRNDSEYANWHREYECYVEEILKYIETRSKEETAKAYFLEQFMKNKEI